MKFVTLFVSQSYVSAQLIYKLTVFWNTNFVSFFIFILSFVTTRDSQYEAKR